MSQTPESNINPYSVPASQYSRFDPLEPSPTTFSGSKTFRFDNRLISNILCVLLGLDVILCPLQIVSGLMQLSMISSEFDQAAALSNDIREGILGLAAIGLYVVTVIFFSIWIVRAHHNVRGFGANGMTISPGWAVGYFFIPFINLVRPYIAMSELWRASKRPNRWSSLKSGIVPYWWGLWIVSNILGNIVGRMHLRANDLQSLSQATEVDILHSSIETVLAIVALCMVWRIQKMQEDWVNTPIEVITEDSFPNVVLPESI